MATSNRRHLFRNGNRQNSCLWCGKPVLRCDPFEDCRVDTETRIALKRYAVAVGRRWKSSLQADWERGGVSEMGYAIDPLLVRLRNIIGPSGLRRITPLMLERVVA